MSDTKGEIVAHWLLKAKRDMQSRYPGDFFEPDQAEFDEAYEAADLICRTIMANLPE
ncbi:MAG: hypothetical protein P1P74_02555 [Desulfuromonadales bacterium]|nr:hypothetical protein [Desulfuromonadales bacterium]